MNARLFKAGYRGEPGSCLVLRCTDTELSELKERVAGLSEAPFAFHATTDEGAVVACKMVAVADNHERIVFRGGDVHIEFSPRSIVENVDRVVRLAASSARAFCYLELRHPETEAISVIVENTA